MKRKQPAEPYVPDLGIVYPDKPDGRMVNFKVVRDITLDENYPFLDRTFSFRLKRVIIYLTIFTLVRLLSFLRFGLKIEGRNILRKHRKLFKNGAMTVSNHVQRWDFMFVQLAVRYHMMYFPVWKEQLRSPDMTAIRLAGGIPIPDNIQTMKHFNKAFDDIHAQKKWFHAFPESSRFDYFHSIRPFKKGVFTMAYRYNVPIIPLAISWRKPHFFSIDNLFRSMAGKQKLPMITIRIGEPLLFDPNLPRKEAVQKMRKDCHAAVVRLAGIRDNPYPAEGD
jgi:1-acyl-sn-glycerol-3-phosphate acyltransferase